MSPAVAGTPPQFVANWHRDPFGRFEYRWHDGQVWTDTVATNGVQSVDRAVATPTPPALQPPLLQPPSPVPQQSHSPAAPQWQSQWQPQPAAPSPKKSGALVKGVLAVVGVVFVAGSVAAIVSSSSSEDEPTPAQPDVSIALTDEVATLSAQLAWDQSSAEDRESMCFAWTMSPELAEGAFISGAGPENEEFWPPFEEILRSEC